MEDDLQISLRGLPEEQANNLGYSIQAIVKVFEKGDAPLDFRRMHRIIVAADFAEELAKLSSDTASGNQITHTNEKYAVAVAKVMLLPYGDEFEIVPILNAQIAINLVQENDEGYDSDDFLYTLHLFHHELCPVHDDN